MNKGKIDWNDIRRRLEQADATIRKGASPGPEEKTKILRARAQVLAKRQAEPSSGASLEVVEFQIGPEQYGIETRFVREVIPLRDFTPVPGVPNFVFGLINVRGQILSVVDIRRFFEMPEKGLSDLNRVIIIHSGAPAQSSAEGPALSKAEGMEFGILADAILRVRAVPLDELQPSLPTLVGVREEFLKGVTRERLVLLDAEKLLKDNNLVVHEEA